MLNRSCHLNKLRKASTGCRFAILMISRLSNDAEDRQFEYETRLATLNSASHRIVQMPTITIALVFQQKEQFRNVATTRVSGAGRRKRACSSRHPESRDAANGRL